MILNFIIVFTFSSQAQAPEKVTICHFTSSETNPWNRIVTSPNAISGHFNNNGTPKAGHEDDLLYEEEWTCPTYCGDGICNGIETCILS